MDEILALFEKLKLIRVGSGDDFELRSSVDEKVWGVRTFSEDPAKPTFAIFAGPDARDSACDLADFELAGDDEDDEEDNDEDDDD